MEGERIMENITIKINGMEVSAPEGSTILEAARLAHVEIPTLCYLKDLNEIAACRMCTVKINGGKLAAACVYPINPGLEVWTNTPDLVEYRKKKGILKSLKQLSLYEEFTPQDLERISHYICFCLLYTSPSPRD